jgi:L-rhamnonate dehydratase
MAAAYDIPVVPHASGPYSYHFVISQTNCPFQEYLANSPDGKSVLPVFGDLFLDEPIPVKGYLDTTQLDKPGFGLTLNPAARLIPARYLLTPDPKRPLGQILPQETEHIPETAHNAEMNAEDKPNSMINGIIKQAKELVIDI